MFKWVLLLFFLTGCGGEFSLMSESELEGDTDLGLYIEELRSEGKIPSDVSLESESEESVVYEEPPENLVAQVSSNNNPGDSDISSWTQSLHEEVHQEDRGGKKFVEPASGKKSVAQNSPRTDLVGDSREVESESFSRRPINVPSARVAQEPFEFEQEEPQHFSRTPRVVESYPVIEGGVEIIGDIKPPVVDVLVVLDLSYSTRYLRRNHMRDQLKGFLAKLEPLNWRLGIINSSIGRRSGFLPIGQNLFINSLESEEMFLTAVEASKDAGTSERPLAALDKFFKTSDSIRFMREDSDGLAVVIISDKDEGRLNNKGQMITSEQLLYTYQERFGYDKPIRGYSLTIVSDSCYSTVYSGIGSKEGRYAPVVTEFVDRTSGRGRSFNLCASDYSPVADTITKDFFINERGI